MADIHFFNQKAQAMKILFYCILFTSFVYSNCFAQTSQKESFVYLHDGSIYIGEILSEDLFEITLKTKALKIITINKAFVKKTHLGTDIILTKDGKYHNASNKFISFDWMGGSNARGDGMGHFSIMAGKRLNPRTEFGAGIGMLSATTSTNDVWRDQGFLNLFVYGKKYLSDKSVRLYTDMKLGWSTAIGTSWRGDYKGGLFVNPGIGIQLASRKKMKWSFRLSQMIQQTSGTEQFPWFGVDPLSNASISYKNWLNRTSFSIGINF